MPCNDPELDMTAVISTSISLTDKDALKLALYDLAAQYKHFFYEETTSGFQIRSEWGDLSLIWMGTKYEITGRVSQGIRATNPILSRYQAIKVQNTLIEKGYLTEPTFLENNTVQLTARRI
jgi:hypothetical protein